MIDMTNTSTRATTPCIIWVHEVICGAGCSVDEMERYCTRERLLRWYQSSEPVWMAAESLRQFVRQGKIHERAEHEATALRDMIAMVHR